MSEASILYASGRNYRTHEPIHDPRFECLRTDNALITRIFGSQSPRSVAAFRLPLSDAEWLFRILIRAMWNDREFSVKREGRGREIWYRLNRPTRRYGGYASDEWSVSLDCNVFGRIVLSFCFPTEWMQRGGALLLEAGDVKTFADALWCGLANIDDRAKATAA